MSWYDAGIVFVETWIVGAEEVSSGGYVGLIVASADFGGVERWDEAVEAYCVFEFVKEIVDVVFEPNDGKGWLVRSWANENVVGS